MTHRNEIPWWVFELPYGTIAYVPAASQESARRKLANTCYKDAPVNLWACLGSRYASREALSSELLSGVQRTNESSDRGGSLAAVTTSQGENYDAPPSPLADRGSEKSAACPPTSKARIAQPDATCKTCGTTYVWWAGKACTCDGNGLAPQLAPAPLPPGTITQALHAELLDQEYGEARPFDNSDPNDGAFKRFRCVCGNGIEVTPTWRRLKGDVPWIETACSEACARGTPKARPDGPPLEAHQIDVIAYEQFAEQAVERPSHYFDRGTLPCSHCGITGVDYMRTQTPCSGPRVPCTFECDSPSGRLRCERPLGHTCLHGLALPRPPEAATAHEALLHRTCAKLNANAAVFEAEHRTGQAVVWCRCCNVDLLSAWWKFCPTCGQDIRPAEREALKAIEAADQCPTQATVDIDWVAKAIISLDIVRGGSAVYPESTKREMVRILKWAFAEGQKACPTKAAPTCTTPDCTDPSCPDWQVNPRPPRVWLSPVKDSDLLIAHTEDDGRNLPIYVPEPLSTKRAPRELHCEDCDRDYPTWVAPSPLWNAVVREAADAAGITEPFLCLTCFALRAEKHGIVPTAWVVRPEACTD